MRDLTVLGSWSNTRNQQYCQVSCHKHGWGTHRGTRHQEYSSPSDVGEQYVLLPCTTLGSPPCYGMTVPSLARRC